MATAQPAFEGDGFTGARPFSAALLRRSVQALAGTAWLSSAIFAASIIALFMGAIPAGTPEDWNDSLPRLYVPHSTAGNVGIGLHFALGAVLLLLGPIQLMGSVRNRWPRFHRWTGWVYASAAVITGLGGLTFIVARGTIGGPVMSIGFGLYGALMVLAAVMTVRHAVARRLDAHRAWAIRLFSLAIGSWLYRMYYGFWFLFFGRIGHTKSFDGPLDAVMIFWFYVPNLILAEMFIRARRDTAPGWARTGAATALLGATAFLLLATYFFTAKTWGPIVLWRMGIIKA